MKFTLILLIGGFVLALVGLFGYMIFQNHNMILILSPVGACIMFASVPSYCIEYSGEQS